MLLEKLSKELEGVRINEYVEKVDVGGELISAQGILALSQHAS